jgi:hypothetical protein
LGTGELQVTASFRKLLDPSALDVEAYTNTAVKAVDEYYAATSLGELGWADLLAVADRLDNLNGDVKATLEILDTIEECFVKKQTVERCTQLLIILHLRNCHALDGFNNASEKVPRVRVFH